MAQKKVRDQPTVTRQSWIGVDGDVSQRRQCILAGVARATVYAKRRPLVIVVMDVVLKNLIDDEYTRNPFYANRKMVLHLARCGHKVNRKRAQRLMRSMGLVAVMDWYSRRVLNWPIGNGMEALFCVDCLEDALSVQGKPEVFNSDQWV